MKSIKILVILLILYSIAVVAQPVELSLNHITNNIEPGETATFTISIKNNQPVDDTFIISPDELNIAPFSDIFKSVRINPSQIDVPATEERSVVVSVETEENIIPNKNYKTFVRVRSLRNRELKQTQDLTISIVQPKELIIINTDIAKIEPEEETAFEVVIKNTANLILDNIDVYITSDIFNEAYSTKLFPYQEFSKDFSFIAGKAIKPGAYPLTIKIYKDSQLIGKFQKDIEIIANKAVEEKISTNSKLFVRSISITKINQGNVLVKESYSYPLFTFQRFFTTFNPGPTKEHDNQVEWLFGIEPGKEYTISITTDYRPLLIMILIAFVVAYFLIKVASKGVKVKKSVFKIISHSGGVFELKVMLHIKNNTLVRITDIQLIDFLPNIIKTSQEFGTLKPNKIQNTEKGMRLIWNIISLEKGEERIVSYKVKPSLHIIGRLSLPSAILRYKGAKSKQHQIPSNRLVFYSDKNS